MHNSKNLQEVASTKLITNMEVRLEKSMQLVMKLLRLLFIIIMTLYLLECLISLSANIITLAFENGILNFSQMKTILTDALFTLIVFSTVKSLFIRSNYIYAVTFLEIGFVVLVRKLILLEMNPSDTLMMLILGLISALFFGLIIFSHRFNYVSKYISKDNNVL